MKRANEEAGAIVLECELPDAPEKVWRALTEPELLAAWLMPNDFRAQLGAEFSFRPPPELGSEAPIACKVLAIEPPHLLRFSWREASEAAAGSLSFVLAPTETGGTHLQLVHRAAATATHVDAPENARLGELLHFPTRTRVAGSKPPESMRCAA